MRRILRVPFLFIFVLVACAPTSKVLSPTGTISLTIEPTIAPANSLSPTLTETSIPFIPTPLAPPPGVMNASMTYDRERKELALFGGGNPSQCVECSAIWVWDGLTWMQRQPIDSPSGREGAGFAYDEAHQNSVLFGSSSQSIPYINDTWVWDGQNWIEEHPLVSPPARSGSANLYLVYDFARKVDVLFGGCAPDPNSNHIPICFNDTWLWDGENWKQANPSTAPPPLGGIPSAMAYDGLHQNVVLYGFGTWIWDGTNWTEQHPAHSPKIPFYGVMGYDEISNQLVLVGRNSDNITQTWIWDGKDWNQTETHLQLGFGSSPYYLFFDTMHQVLILFMVNASKAGVTGSSMWIWQGNDWSEIY